MPGTQSLKIKYFIKMTEKFGNTPNKPLTKKRKKTVEAAKTTIKNAHQFDRN